MRSQRPLRGMTTGVAAALLLAGSLAGCGVRSGSNSGSGANPVGVTDNSITVGSSFPLSGPLGANGIAAQGAITAYFDAVNAKGGVKMSDGKTRKLVFKSYDDGYKADSAVQNYSKLVNQDHVFALLQTFGTATNIAVMPKANADGVPQVFVHAGDALFSDDPKGKPWTVGWQPTYEAEGKAQGEALAAQNKPLTVGVLRQSDTLGDAFLQGFQEGIQGTQVKIVGNETYAPRDATVDSQISSLAATKADVLFMAVSVPPLMIGGINHVVSLGWQPQIIMVSMSSSISQVINGGHLQDYPKLFTAECVKAPDDPQWQNDPAVKTMVSQMKQYAPNANPAITNAQWAYGAAVSFVDALKNMKKISRKGLMDAVRSLKQPGNIGILLPGVTYDGTDQHNPPVHGFQIEHYENGSWKAVGKVISG